MRRLLAFVVSTVALIAGPGAPAAAAASWGTGVEAILPGGAGSNPAVSLSSVACASPGSCTAVGTYFDSSSSGQGVLLGESGGTWATGVQAPLPANAEPAFGTRLSAVSCASAGNCGAVGEYYDALGSEQGVLLTETGGTWATGVEATLPAGAGSDPFVSLSSVSCASAGNCTAVGQYTVGSSNQQGLLLTETAGVWATGVQAVLPAGAAPSDNVALNSVSCTSAGSCAAAGEYDDTAGNQQGVLLTETGGTWAPGVEVTPPANSAASPNATIVLRSVSCASAGNCAAVGYYADSSSHEQGLLLTQSGGTWATGIEATLPAGAGSNPSVTVASVSCASAGDCTAVGQYNDSSGGGQGLLVTETAGVWASGIEAALPAGGSNASPSSVSCASAGNCTAVGSYSVGSNNRQGLLLTETGGVWATGVQATLPANARSTQSGFMYISSVSCSSPGECSAVGQYDDTSPALQGLLLGETSGITEFSAGLNSGSNPNGIAAGPDGNVWFTDNGTTAAVGEINPGTDTISELSTGLNAGSALRGIAAGPDGNLWFADSGTTKAIGQLNPSTRAISEFSSGLSSTSAPSEITAGPDGNIWFTDTGCDAPCAIGQVNPSTHAIGEFTAGLLTGTVPIGIAAGPDGNLWFADSGARAIGVIDPSTDAISEFSTGLNAGSKPREIAAGPDGNLWFTDSGTTPAIGEINPSTHAISEFSTGLNSGSSPNAIAGGPGCDIWFTDDGMTKAIGQVPTLCALTVSKAGSGSGTVSSADANIDCGGTCSHSYAQGTQVTLTATPASGSSFAGWAGGGCSGTGTCTVTISSDQTITASFTANPPAQQTLTVTPTGSGSGTIASSPSGISCPGACSHAYDQGSQITLSATAATGSTFAGWTGAGCSGAGACTLTLSSDTTVSAAFTANPTTTTTTTAPTPTTTTTAPTPTTTTTAPTPTTTTATPPSPLARPANTLAPAIAGNPKPGMRLTCPTGSWTANPTSYTYQWARYGTPIPGASTPTYTPTTLDEGATLTCTVTAINPAGDSQPATSAPITIALPAIKGCPKASGTVSGARIGLVTLGMTRAQAHHAYRHSSNRGKPFEDFFCLTPIGVRVGYASPKLARREHGAERIGRIVWISTSNPYYAIAGIRPGATLVAALGALPGGNQFQIGANHWYLVAHGSVTAILKSRGGLIEEIGIAARTVTRTKAAQHAFLTSGFA